MNTPTSSKSSGEESSSISESELERLAASEPDSEMEITNAPNLVTLSRIALIPLVVGLMFFEEPSWDWVAGILFGLVSATDWLDGYLARKRNQITVFGKLMDPLADKFLVTAALITLESLGRIHPVVVILLICREIAITGLRALASAEGVVIAASTSAKWKTATQMVAIPMLMINEDIWMFPTYYVGLALIYLSLFISLWSAQSYVFDFFKALKVTRAEKRRKRLARKLRKKRSKKKRTRSSERSD